MPKQVEFKDFAEDIICSGILLDDGCVLCACCGGIFEADERGETWEIVKEYESWVNFEVDLGSLLHEDYYERTGDVVDYGDWIQDIQGGQ